MASIVHLSRAARSVDRRSAARARATIALQFCQLMGDRKALCSAQENT